MIGATGFGLTFLGFAGALIGLALALMALRGRRPIDAAVRSAQVTAGALVAANIVMVAALVSHDFSISYVAQVGSRTTPLLYTVASLWGALEGSILFWAGLLSVVLLLLAVRTGGRDREDLPAALAVLFGVLAFFAFIVLVPGDPGRLCASCEKIKAELGWEPKYPDIETILRHAYEWRKAHPAGYRT